MKNRFRYQYRGILNSSLMVGNFLLHPVVFLSFWKSHCKLNSFKETKISSTFKCVKDKNFSQKNPSFISPCTCMCIYFHIFLSISSSFLFPLSVSPRWIKIESYTSKLIKAFSIIQIYMYIYLKKKEEKKMKIYMNIDIHTYFHFHSHFSSYHILFKYTTY